jgi:hypothetical protein
LPEKIPDCSAIAVEILSLLQPAALDTSDHPECSPGTRTDILNPIKDWGTSLAYQNVFWFHGLAGSGKSTISTTLASHFHGIECLGASLSFNRDFKESSDPGAVIRTLAYQLALFDSRLGVAISRVITSNHGIVHAPTHLQFTKLVIEPLLSIADVHGRPIVIILDALDECGSPAERQNLVQVLSEKTVGIHFLRLFITSRTDYHIRHTFKSQRHIPARELDVSSASNHDDIKSFLVRSMSAIRERNTWLPLGHVWPGEDAIHTLTNRAAGLFVFASTASALIDSFDPESSLNKILDEGIHSDAQAALDSLYITALEAVGDWNDTRFAATFRRIMGTIVVAKNPLSPWTIDKLLGLERMPSFHMISRLGCVLRCNSELEQVRILHPSFIDFLSDLLRCRSEKWYINTKLHNGQFTLDCLDHLNRDGVMRQNICNLTLSPGIAHIDVTLEPDIAYACTFWIEHMCAITEGVGVCCKHLEAFVFQHFLHWMEAMSILQKSRAIIGLLEVLLNWIRVSVGLLFVAR